MSPRALAPLILAALALAPAATAGSGSDAKTTVAAIDRLAQAGRLSDAEARELRVVVRRARFELLLLPGSRGSELAAVLAHVAREARSAGAARLRVLIASLDESAGYLGVHSVPPPRTSVHDQDGLVYRAFSGFGLQFHPLATFGRLNSLVSRGDRFGAARLASRLLQLGGRRGDSLVWSYEFPFGGGQAPWTSGMAQAVAAQSLARAASKLGTTALLDPARRAFAAIPGGLLEQMDVGPWIRLYSFNDLVVLNAQLQTAISLDDYGVLAGDTLASALSVEIRRAAAELLPRFDTGYWSRYTTVGESSLEYHVYVVSLLEKLAERTDLSFWRRAASRFDRYTHEAPKLDRRGALPALYPAPADGWRDTAAIRFWLSKRSDVTVAVGRDRRTLALGQGVHAFPWTPPSGAQRVYPVRLAAVDLAGNRSAVRLPDLRVRVDRRPPRVKAEVRGRWLRWKVRDRGTPSVRLELRLWRGDDVRVRTLGTRRLRGSLRIRPPRREWHAALRVADVSGNKRRVPLGVVGGRVSRSSTAPTIR
jgi:D-glucuronyl C5-epimerase C-terminus